MYIQIFKLKKFAHFFCKSTQEAFLCVILHFKIPKGKLLTATRIVLGYDKNKKTDNHLFESIAIYIYNTDSLFSYFRLKIPETQKPNRVVGPSARLGT